MIIRNPVFGKSDKGMELQLITFETIGFDVLCINQDPDYFSMKVKNFDHHLNQKNGIRIEPLVFSALELFSRLVFNPNVYTQSNSFFISLNPYPLFSSIFNLEIDYLNTSKESVYLEAYCYDDRDLLVGKGGVLFLRD